MADKRIQQYPEKVAPSTSDYLLIADAEDVDVNGYLKYKKVKISGLDNIVITNAEDITLTALNTLISTNALVIGRFYRITDSLSGVNPIIVQAVALNILSELAVDSDTGLVYTYVVSTDTATSFPSMSVYVPYTGATASVDLGEYQIKVGQVELDQTPTQSFGVGKMRWNDTDGTAEIGLKGGNVTLQIGQEQLARVVNKTGVNLTEAGYKVVRISGAQGQRLKVGLAQANSTTTCKDTLGLVTEDINNNAEGFITTSGIVHGINTTGSLQSETWADGDRLYLSPSVAGGITKVEPSAPNIVIVLGYVVYAHANQGSIYVSVEGAKALHELFDVSIPSPTNNNILVYDSATSLWKDKSLGTIIGGSSSQFVKGDGSLDSNTYLTTISGITSGGELSGTYPNPNLVNSAVTGKVLTGLSVTGSAIVSTDSMLTAFGKLQNQVNALVGGVNYRGTWNASTNTPSLASGVGTQGYYYVVSVAGSTNLDGITEWALGDWAIFNGTVWQKVDNTDAVVSVNGYTGIVTLSATDVSALPTSAMTGTTGYLQKTTSSGVIGNSNVFDSGAVVSIVGTDFTPLSYKNTSNPTSKTGFFYSEPNITGMIDSINGAGGFNAILFDDSIKTQKFYTNGVLRMTLSNTQIITNSATNTGEHFIIGGSTRVNGALGVIGGDISISAGNKLAFSATSYITPENNVSGAEIATAGVLTIKTGGTTERVRVDASGNVGIGTTSTQGILQVLGNGSNASNGFIITTNAFTFLSSGSFLRFGHTATSGNAVAIIENLTVGGTANGALALNGGSGNVLIGTTTDNGVDKLQVSGSANFTSNITSKNYNAILKDGSDTIGSGAYIGLVQVSDSKQALIQLNGSQGITFWHYNGSGWGSSLILNNTGSAIFSSSVTSSGHTITSGNNLTMTQGDIQFSSNSGYGILSADSSRLIAIQNGLMTINGRLNISSLPTSPSGLSAGDLWNNSGVVSIV